MIPATYPVNSNKSMVVYFVDPTGQVAWRDYIPVNEADSATAGSFDDDGAIQVEVLSSITGKKAWIDYIPVVQVSA